MVLVALILAAGRGTRMRSALPKVLHTVGGQPMVARVLTQAHGAGVRHFVLVVPSGNDGAAVRRAAYTWRSRLPFTTNDNEPRLYFAEQRETLGTAHAVRAATEALDRIGATRVVVLCGDVPLLRSSTLLSLIAATDAEPDMDAALLGVEVDEPHGFGRLVQEPRGVHIVEERDCTDAQRAIRRVNAGVYVFGWHALRAVLPRIACNNAQREYYLTDAIGMLSRVVVVDHDRQCAHECMGVNTREQLIEANRRWDEYAAYI